MTRRVNLRTSSTPQDRALPISFSALDVLQAGMGVRVFLYVRRALKAPTSLPFLGCFFSCLLGVLVGAGQALRDTLTVCASESSITSCCSFFARFLALRVGPEIHAGRGLRGRGYARLCTWLYRDGRSGANQRLGGVVCLLVVLCRHCLWDAVPDGCC